MGAVPSVPFPLFSEFVMLQLSVVADVDTEYLQCSAQPLTIFVGGCSGKAITAAVLTLRPDLPATLQRRYVSTRAHVLTT